MSSSKENKIIIDGQTYYGGLNQTNLKFVKVNVDCWEKIFDFLSLRDILAMSQTCQRMRQIGGHYYRENFHGSTCRLLKLVPGLRFCIASYSIEREDFLRFVDSAAIQDISSSDGFKILDYFRTVSCMGLLCSLTTLSLWEYDLSENRLEGFENIQPIIETIVLFKCSINDNCLSEFLASCPKLKCLRFDWVDFKSAEVKASLFERTYPMLECIECIRLKDTNFGWKSFLERNLSIKGIRINDVGLRNIPFDTTTFKLDYLKIEIDSDEDYTVELANRLKTLHKNERYKTLRVYLWSDHETFVNEMASFIALEALNTKKFFANVCHLTGLKELHFQRPPRDVDLEPIAVKLINLERLWINNNFEQLSPFLRHSKSLKMVILNHFNDSNEALDLFTLNRVRRMGGMKSKVRIGVKEWRYLATKWMTKNLNCDLVEIVRIETIKGHFTSSYN